MARVRKLSTGNTTRVWWGASTGPLGLLVWSLVTYLPFVRLLFNGVEFFAPTWLLPEPSDAILRACPRLVTAPWCFLGRFYSVSLLPFPSEPIGIRLYSNTSHCNPLNLEF
jgi:hypothetical protein